MRNSSWVAGLHPPRRAIFWRKSRNDLSQLACGHVRRRGRGRVQDFFDSLIRRENKRASATLLGWTRAGAHHQTGSQSHQHEMHRIIGRGSG